MCQTGLKLSCFTGANNMGALIFMLVWHFGNPVFTSRGFSDKQRFFSAAAIGALFEVAIFTITGTTAYGIVVD